MFIDIIKVINMIKQMLAVEPFFIAINDYEVEGLIHVFSECLFLFVVFFLI